MSLVSNKPTHSWNIWHTLDNDCRTCTIPLMIAQWTISFFGFTFYVLRHWQWVEDKLIRKTTPEGSRKEMSTDLWQARSYLWFGKKIEIDKDKKEKHITCSHVQQKIKVCPRHGYYSLHWLSLSAQMFHSPADGQVSKCNLWWTMHCQKQRSHKSWYGNCQCQF